MEPATVCTAQGNRTRYEFIAAVNLGAITNESGNDNGYGDYTNLSTTLTPDTDYTLTLTPGYAGSAYREYWSVWIDYNGDGDFEDTNELIGQVSGNTPQELIFTTPSTLANPAAILRVSMKYGSYATACEAFAYGEVEDYTVLFDVDEDMRPTCDDRIQNGDETGIDCGGIDCPPCEGPLPIEYCTSNGNRTRYEYIGSITLEDIRNESGDDGGYADYTNLSTDLAQGGRYTIDLVPVYAGTAYREYWTVRIDFNQDGEFDDATELLIAERGEGTLSFDFTIPEDALIGETRMRVSMQYGSFPDACGTYSYGEVEDYTVNIGVAGDAFKTAATNELGEISVYPNPMTNNLQVEFQKNTFKQLKIMDASGNVIQIQVINQKADQINMDVSNLAKGMYFIVLEGAEVPIYKKVIKVQ